MSKDREDINRIKVVLVEKKRTNTCQPDLANFMQMANLLDVELNDLARFDEFKRSMK